MSAKKSKMIIKLNNLKQGLKTSQIAILKHQDTVIRVGEQIKVMEEDIKALNDVSSFKVTDHAIIRYMERIQGIDFGLIRGILSDSKMIAQLRILGGNGTFPVDGAKAVVKNFSVVTILEK